MSSPSKAIPTQEEDEHDTLAQNRRLPSSANSKIYGKPKTQRLSPQSQNNIRVILLITFLIVCMGAFTIRYMQLRDRDTNSRFHKEETQSYIQQSVDFSKSISNDDNSVQHKSTNPAVDNLYSAQDIKLETDQSSVHGALNPQNRQQLSVLQDIAETDQNFLELKTESEDLLVDMSMTGNDEIDTDEGELDGPVDDSSKEELNENGMKSVEETELLNSKDEQKVDQLHTFTDGQFELHPKAKPFEQNPESTLQNTDSQNSENLDAQRDQQTNSLNGKSQQNIDRSSNNNEVTQNDQQSQPETVNQAPQQQNPKSTMQFSQQDLFDPIIRVKDMIQEKFKTKFQDLIYIKAGTNITQSQYYKARQRMSIWKYFNPSTGNLQLLSEVTYEPQVIATPQSIYQSIEQVKKVIRQQQFEYEQNHQVSSYEEIPFCIIIPSYKNQDKYMRNLNSILQQDYQNYHIIYIDDASQDGSADKVKAYIQKYNISQKRLNFIQNAVNKKALPNIDYAARRLCNSGQIMAIIDGDDYLIGTQVFKLINARYQKENLLVLYTNHLRVHEPIYLKVGTCIDYPERIKKARAYRRFSIFPASHLRTFYVDLYWRINIRDLKDYRRQYFSAANDFAIMMPILEMAGNRYEYLSELTYVYDAGTGFNNFQTKADTQAKNYRITKRRHRYPKLVKELEFQKKFKDRQIQNSLMDSVDLPLSIQSTEQSPGSKLKQRMSNY